MNSLAIEAAELLLNDSGIRWTILLSLQVNVQIASYPLGVRGRPVTKSIVTTLHLLSGGGIGMGEVLLRLEDFEARHVGQVLT
jgi:hypothetical protein